MDAEELCHATFGLKSGYIDVEVETVDPLDLQGDPVAENIGDALRYYLVGSG
jgi:hypothetical protein